MPKKFNILNCLFSNCFINFYEIVIFFQINFVESNTLGIFLISKKMSMRFLSTLNSQYSFDNGKIKCEKIK